MTTTVVYEARKILTMNPGKPTATHVAVRDGRILAVGSLDEVQAWGAAEIDRTFSDKVLMPGLIEGHAHVYEGMVWNNIYTGSYDRRDPDGKVWTGLGTIDQIVGRLAEACGKLDDPEQPLIGWGFDPLFVDRRMVASDLDKVSTTRPVFIYHASLHIINVNSFVLERAGVTLDTDSEFILRDEAGKITGELAGHVGRYLLYKSVGSGEFAAPGNTPESVRRYAKSAQMAGVTTVTDLNNDLLQPTVDSYVKVTAEDDFPVRLMPAMRGTAQREDPVGYLRSLTELNSDRLRFGLVKMTVDGSIQGFTARLRWPGYFNGRPNGLWYTPPEEIKRVLGAFHEAGFQVHIHTNGDEATEAAIEAIEAVQIEKPRPDHRHTLQHCQMADAAQFRRMAKLGACVNLFSNHIYYWGDAHYSLTMGPDRAERMDAVATAMRCGVPVAIHSDAPITPLGPLFTAWCAVNRRTSSGRVLGASECISVDQALHAITLGAAYTLKMEGEVGSIEVGKYADFAVLEDDPTEVAPEALKDVRVWGTVLGGRIFANPRVSP